MMHIFKFSARNKTTNLIINCTLKTPTLPKKFFCYNKEAKGHIRTLNSKNYQRCTTSNSVLKHQFVTGTMLKDIVEQL